MFLAIVFIVLGLFLLLNALGIIVAGNFWGIFWAIILLALGFKMLARKGKCPICGFGMLHGKMHEKFHQKTDECGCGHGHGADNEDEEEE